MMTQILSNRMMMIHILRNRFGPVDSSSFRFPAVDAADRSGSIYLVTLSIVTQGCVWITVLGFTGSMDPSRTFS